MKKIVKFSATWCGPCKVFAKTFNELEQDEDLKDYSFKQVDVDEDEEMLSVKYSVRGVPTVLVLDENDELITRIVGNIPKEQAKKMILGQ